MLIFLVNYFSPKAISNAEEKDMSNIWPGGLEQLGFSVVVTQLAGVLSTNTSTWTTRTRWRNTWQKTTSQRTKAFLSFGCPSPNFREMTAAPTFNLSMEFKKARFNEVQWLIWLRVLLLVFLIGKSLVCPSYPTPGPTISWKMAMQMKESIWRKPKWSKVWGWMVWFQSKVWLLFWSH